MKQFNICMQANTKFMNDILPKGAFYGEYHIQGKNIPWIMINPVDGYNSIRPKRNGKLPVIVYMKDRTGMYIRHETEADPYQLIGKMIVKHFPTEPVKITWRNSITFKEYNQMLHQPGAPRKRKGRALATESSRQMSRKETPRRKSPKKAPVGYDRGKNNVTDYSCGKDTYRFHGGYENRCPEKRDVFDLSVPYGTYYPKRNS